MEKVLLRVSEAAEACSVSRSQMYTLLARGDIPYVVVGSRKRIPVDGLRAWVRQHQVGGTSRPIDG